MYNLLDKILRILRNIIKFFAFLYYLNYKCMQKSKKKPKNSYIPASAKVLNEKELYNMIDASLDMWLTAGRFNDAFEKKFCEFLGIRHCLTVNSGSSANLLAISALTSHQLGERRLNPGDEVITAAAGFPTTVNPIIQNGLVPVFCDVDLGTYNIKVEDIEKSITEKTKAVFIAHTLGNPFNVEQIQRICEKHNLWLIEDNCDALGAKYKDKFTGTYGHISTFSFYPAHHITMGEGGAVATNDFQLYKILLSYRDWGRDCWCDTGKDDTCKNRFNQQIGKLPFGYDHKYTYSHAGYNLKITDWQASIALAQMDKLEYFIQKRCYNFNYLYQKFQKLQKNKKIGDYFIFPSALPESAPSWFGFLLTLKENNGINRLELLKHLEKHGVGTRLLFSGNILRQPMFVNNHFAMKIADSCLLYSDALTEEHYASLPNTETVMKNTFWTGVHPALEREDLDYIFEVVEKFL